MLTRLGLALILFAATGFAGCASETITCVDPGPAVIRLYGFSSTELDSITLRQYESNGRFDSSEQIYGLSLSPFGSESIAQIDNIIAETADYELSIPAASVTYRLSDLTKRPPRTVTYRRIFNKEPLVCYNNWLTYS